MSTPRMPRTSNADVLVHDGEAKKVVHAVKRDTDAIPKEFWATSVNLQWNDLRGEQVRQRDSTGQGRTAEEAKYHNLSSEIFGQNRRKETSTKKLSARQDLMPDSADHLKMDSLLQRNQGAVRGSGMEGSDDAKERMHKNLADSREST